MQIAKASILENQDVKLTELGHTHTIYSSVINLIKNEDKCSGKRIFDV